MVDCTYECDVPGAPATVGAAPDIGAYEFGASVYWMPGPRYAYASSPVPPTNASSVMPDADLMFQPAKNAASHLVYLVKGARLRLRHLEQEEEIVWAGLRAEASFTVAPTGGGGRPAVRGLGPINARGPGFGGGVGGSGGGGPQAEPSGLIMRFTAGNKSPHRPPLIPHF